ncbi:hypothetical protein ACHHYP_15952 [Achlya hypogyna]|uniref:ARID domain-containing protein n=1 Tax=Achlya hypogyna TaxID=1202772 RepID=A0A1V9Y9Q2_ACHHY|nr:hypothetical protein ACHHYP_15952 [Achlya hypogyna]
MQGATPQKQWVELQLLCRGQPGKNRILQSLLAYYTKAVPALQAQPLPVVPDTVLSMPRVLDLVQLYEEVVARGGAALVTDQELWKEVTASMKLKIAPALLQQLYATWLMGFEQAQVGGKAPRRLVPQESIATHAEIQATTSVRYTPLPMVTKRLKTHRQQLADLGVLHRIVLGLDSTLPDHVDWALNQLTVLSYGHAGDADCDVLVDHAPGLLDALFRQLPATASSRAVRLFAPTAADDEHTLRVLNILRNLSMVRENERPIASHAGLRTWLFAVPDSPAHDFALDIVVQVARVLAPPLSSAEWAVVLQPLMETAPRRCRALQSLDVLAACLADAVPPGLPTHPRFALSLQRCVTLLGRRRQDALLTEDDALDSAGWYDDDDEEDFADDGQSDELGHDLGLLPYLATTASSSRELEASLSPTSGGDRVGANMGVVFVSRQAGATPDAKKADFQVRDLALQVLYYLATTDDALRLWIARQPDAMDKIASLVACGRAETARLAVGVLANLSLNPSTWAYFLPIESVLLRVATTDASLSDLVVNVMADVYGMNALP